MTQNDSVIKYMRDFGAITPLDAIRDIGCLRLGARIYDLQKQGYVIKHEMETSVNRYGKEIRYAKYKLEGIK